MNYPAYQQSPYYNPTNQQGIKRDVLSRQVLLFNIIY